MRKTRIRMYRQGLGDCFLITFDFMGADIHVLIDCGVVIGAPEGKAKTRRVVEQLRRDCHEHLHLLVATHEHWDHVSGFVDAQDLFNTITIDQIWMAWTEDPEDRQAKRMRQQRTDRIRGLAAAAQRWRAAIAAVPKPDPLMNVRAENAVAATESLLNFFGDDLLGAKGDKTRAGMEYLRNHQAPKEYLEPGDVLKVPGTNEVRAYVLGPPRDEARIKKDLPSSRAPETYEEPMRLSGGYGFMSAAMQPSGSIGNDDLYQPFDVFYRIPTSEARGDSFFRDHYGFEAGSAIDSPDKAPAWRRIDDDWLASASELALQLDSDTNNTSLVLAFELNEGGDVLLFAADAQVGNWLSWADVKFDRRTATTDDLLSRAVFYKVGHHASHNATLRDNGLEKMTSRRLAAFVPVDKDTATKVRWFKMPFEPLLQRLQEKCRNRIVRLDQGVDGKAPESFRQSIAENELYFDLTLEEERRS